MPWNSRMFWKVRATRALRAISMVGHALEQEELAVRRRGAPRPLACGGGLDVVPCVDNAVAGEREPPFGRLVEAGDAVEHRGLAGAVRPDQRGDVAAPDGEGEGR